MAAKKTPHVTTPARERADRFNATDLARLLQISREAVRQWALQGCPRLDSGEFVIAEVVTWLTRRAVETERAKRKEDGKPKTELNRKLSVEADLKELQLAQLRDELITVEVHEEEMERVVGGFSGVAKGQLARFNRDIVRATTAVDAQKVIDRIHAALMEGAQGLAHDMDEEAADATEEPAA